MAKKSTPEPIIRHTEILARVIRSLEAEIHDWTLRCEGLPEETAKPMLERATADNRKKLEAVKQLYKIETGDEYV